MSWATKYHVETTGNDGTGDGTSGNPWLTISYAISQVSAGDTIMIGAGNFPISAQMAVGVQINFLGEGSSMSILTANTTLSYFFTLYSVSEGTNGNQFFKHIGFDGNLTTEKGIESRGRSNVIIDSCSFTQFNGEAVSLNGRYTGEGAPTVWATGLKVMNSTFINCGSDAYYSEYSSWFASGAIGLSGDQDAEIIHNYIDNVTGGRYGEGVDGIAVGAGYHRGLLIEGNTILLASKHASSGQWNFAIELWNCQGGIIIRDNYLRGMTDFGGTSTSDVGGYGFAALVENNRVVWPNLQQYEQVWLTLESDISGGLFVLRNHTKYVSVPIAFYQSAGPNDVVEDVTIAYNIFEQTLYSAGNYTGRCVTFVSVNGATYRRIKYLNNVQYVTHYIGSAGFHCGDYYLVFEDIEIKNNIFYGSYNQIRFEGDTIRGLDVQNNLHFQYTNPITFVSCTTSDYVNSDNITNQNPLFKSATDFHLQPTSPCIDAGLDVSSATGGTDFNGASVYGGIYDIGAFEYGANRLLRLNSIVLPTINYNIILIDH